MKRRCHSRASSTVGVSRWSARSAISSRRTLRFCLSSGLSASQSGTQDLSQFVLDRPARLGRSADLRLFERFAFQRILHRRLTFHNCRDRPPKSPIFLPIRPQIGETCLQAALLFAPLVKVVLDRLVQQLVDRAALDLAEVLESIA